MLTPVLDALLKELDSLRNPTPVPVPLPSQDVFVPTGGDIQAFLDTVPFGSTIWLAAGATYKVNLRLRNRPGVGTITLRTAGLNDTVLVPGVRVSPPDGLKMAKLAPLDTLLPTLSNLVGAHDYSFIGLEFVGNTVHPDRDLVMFGYDTATNKWAGSFADQPSNILIDRCYIHGEPATGGHRGVMLEGKNMKVLNSYVSEFWEQGRDSQAIGLFQAQGPILIENNYLEASGENFLSGGSDPVIPGAIPSDITFRGNYCFKPLSWKQKPGSVKNIFELKNAQRVLVEGNLFENCWTDGQNGSAILFTVRNQDGAAPWCTVKDVVFQNNIVKNVQTFAFNILSTDNNHLSGFASNIRIVNNLMINVGRGLQVTQAITGLEVSHNTFTGVGYTFLTLDTVTGKMTGMNIQNNVTPGGIYGIAGSGVPLGTPTLDAFWAPDYKFAGNVIEGNIERIIPYPAGNFLLAPNTLTPRLDPKLRYTGIEVGTDGRRPGADIDALTLANKNSW